MPDYMPDYRGILLEFLASLTLCDHMGDVCNHVQTVMDRIGIAPDFEWEKMSDLMDHFGRMGVDTLAGTHLTPDEG